MRAFAVALLLFLAGCADPLPEPPADEPAGPGVVTAPGDYGQDNGTSPHIHDYWGGMDRIQVMSMDHQDLGPGFTSGSDVIVHEYLGTRDEVIPQGAQNVTVTLEWSDDSLDQYTDPQLWVQTAAESEARFIADAISGEPVTWTLTTSDWDLPHQRLSAWRYQLRMSDEGGMLRFKGNSHITVEAERGLPLPTYPAHPDHWNGATEIQLFDTTHSLTYFHDVQDGGCNGFSCQVDHRPDDGVIVPPGTSIVVVRLTPDGSPTTIGLEYHSGAQREFERPTATMDGATQVYEIAVGADHDGPYAHQSLWEFRAYITGPMADGIVAESYSIDATAVQG